MLLEKLKRPHQETGQKESRFETHWDMIASLSHAGYAEEEPLTPEEEHEQDLYIFKFLQYTHLATFVI